MFAVRNGLQVDLLVFACERERVILNETVELLVLQVVHLLVAVYLVIKPLPLQLQLLRVLLTLDLGKRFVLDPLAHASNALLLLLPREVVVVLVLRAQPIDVLVAAS